MKSAPQRLLTTIGMIAVSSLVLTTAHQKLVLDATPNAEKYDVSSFWNLPEFVWAGWLQPLDEYFNKANDERLKTEDISEGAIESMTVDDELGEFQRSSQHWLVSWIVTPLRAGALGWTNSVGDADDFFGHLKPEPHVPGKSLMMPGSGVERSSPINER